MKQCTYRTSISEEHGVFRWNQGAFGQILAKEEEEEEGPLFLASCKRSRIGALPGRKEKGETVSKFCNPIKSSFKVTQAKREITLIVLPAIF